MRAANGGAEAVTRPLKTSAQHPDPYEKKLSGRSTRDEACRSSSDARQA